MCLLTLFQLNLPPEAAVLPQHAFVAGGRKRAFAADARTRRFTAPGRKRAFTAGA